MIERMRVAAGWRLLVLAVPPLIATAAVLVGVLHSSAPATAAAAAGPPAEAVAEAELPAPPVPGLLVDVTGAVAQPGLYRLHRGERVYAAIAAAGGLTRDADPARLPNLAGGLHDGQQVRVPTTRGRGRTATTAAADLNVASSAQLAEVPGFTPELAAAAVEYRTRFGGFRSPRELVTQLGMGEAEYARAHRFVRA